MKTSEVLNIAADLIEVRGWQKGEGWYTGDDQAGLCLEGGIQAALGRTHDKGDMGLYFEFKLCPAYQAVLSYLDLAETRYAYDFNDHYSTTKTDVIEVLRGAAVVEAVREEQEVMV